MDACVIPWHKGKKRRGRRKGDIMLSIFECLVLVPVGHEGSWAKDETNEKICPRNVAFGT